MQDFLEISRKSFPKVDGFKIIERVKEEIEILWDMWGIPHIFTNCSEDAYFSHGYVHACHRLFQMELFRRVITGELSEIIGEESLDSDKHYKIIGLHRIAENSAKRIRENQDTDLIRHLEAYKNGVNAGIAKARINPPLEFAALNLQIRDWDKSICIIPGGQSGLPFHRHYNDLIKLYVKGKYIPMLFTKEAISKNLEGILKLQPK